MDDEQRGWDRLMINRTRSDDAVRINTVFHTDGAIGHPFEKAKDDHCGTRAVRRRNGISMYCTSIVQYSI